MRVHLCACCKWATEAENTHWECRVKRANPARPGCHGCTRKADCPALPQLGRSLVLGSREQSQRRSRRTGHFGHEWNLTDAHQTVRSVDRCTIVDELE